VLPGRKLCRIPVDIIGSSRTSRPVPADVRSASKQAIGGSTLASVGHADMSDVAMTLRTGTRPRIFVQAVIRSSMPMIRRKDGAGVTSTRSPLTFPTPRPDRPDTAVYLTNMTGPAQPGRCLMAKVDERTIANMDVLLEEVFGDVPHGGDHESRKHVV
jgi:hypothetical protein